MTFGMFMGTIRGGSSESTVVVADQEIVTPPIVPHVWAVLGMHPEGLPKLAGKVERGGVLLLNSSLIVRGPDWADVTPLPVPATELAKQVGQAMGAGMVLLGAFAAATGLVTLDSLQAALDDVLPSHRRALADANRRCLEIGAAHPGGATVPAWPQ
jgi:2-oxoglutarate ferredoxin oxidoreductase subunit gamma